MVLGGGPSLNDFEREIREQRESGMLLVTTNGTYNWCLDRGIKPSMQVVVDGRAFNKRFVLPNIKGCHYFLASQCSPEIIEAAPRDQIYLWHGGDGDSVKNSLETFDNNRKQGRNWYPIMGGSTVMLRALPMLIMLGYHRFHIYGFDSCISGGKHHAYEQTENDTKYDMGVRLDGKEFRCNPWMWIQAQEFIDMQKMIAEHCEMAVYGNGLIAHIIQTACKLSKEQEDGSRRIQYVQQLEAVSD